MFLFQGQNSHLGLACKCEGNQQIGGIFLSLVCCDTPFLGFLGVRELSGFDGLGFGVFFIIIRVLGSCTHRKQLIIFLLA